MSNNIFQVEEHETIPIDFSHELITENSRAEKVVKDLMTKKALGVDTETTALDPFILRWLMTQISDGKKAYLFDMRQIHPEVIKPPLESSEILKIIQHVPFDYKVMRKHGIVLDKVYDTSLAEQVLNAGIMRESNLPFLVRRHLGFKMSKETRETFLSTKDEPFNKRQIKYAVDDVSVLPIIYKEQVKKLKQEDLGKIAMLEFACAPAVAMMEYNGIALDREKWGGILEDARKNQKEKGAELIEFFEPYAEQLDLFGNIGINLDSQQQLINWFQKAGFDIGDTQDSTIKSMALQHPAFEILREYRKFNKILDAYGENLLEKINTITGRLHPDIRQMGARSGRFSFANPGLQQIPKENKYRNCFYGKPGWKVITADYSQQELRIAAHASQDPIFIQFFLDDVDVHCRTAEFIYGVPWQDILAAKEAKDAKKPFNKEYIKYRTVAKNVSFLILYGGTPFGLSNGIGCTPEEAEDIFRKYFAPFTRLKGWIENTQENVLKNKYAINLGGRKRYFRFPEQNTNDFHKAIFKAQRIGVNHMIQSTAADIMKLALGKIYKWTKNSSEMSLLLSVHDEIVMDCDPKVEEDVKRGLVKIMEESFLEYCSSVPIKVDATIENFWTK